MTAASCVAGRGNSKNRPDLDEAPTTAVTGLALWTGPRPGILVLSADRSDSWTRHAGRTRPDEIDGIDWFAPTLGGSTGRLAVHPRPARSSFLVADR